MLHIYKNRIGGNEIVRRAFNHSLYIPIRFVCDILGHNFYALNFKDEDEDDFDDDENFYKEDEEDKGNPFEREPADDEIKDEDFPKPITEDDLLDDDEEIPYN